MNLTATPTTDTPGVEQAQFGALMPAKALADNKQKQVKISDKPLVEFFRGIAREIDEENSEEERKRAGIGVRNHMYWKGGLEACGFLDKQGNWRPHKDTRGYYNNNQLAYQINTLLATLLRAATKLRVVPTTNKPQKVGAANVSTRFLQHQQNSLLRPEFREKEWLRAMLYRRYFRYTHYTTDVRGATARVPKMAERQVTMPGLQICTSPKCGMTKLLDAAAPSTVAGQDGQRLMGTDLTGGQATCKTCGSPADVIMGPSDTAYDIDGYDEIPAGSIITESVHPFEVKIALDADSVNDSPYLRRIRYMRKNKLEYKFGIKLQGGALTDPVLRQKQALTGADARSVGSSTNSNFLEYKQYWVEPCYYHDYAPPEDVDLASGVTIPKGTPLIEWAPEGVYFCLASDDVKDMRPENKNDLWCGSVYYMDPSSGDGKGIEDATDLQEWINEIHSLKIDHFMRNSLPQWLIDSSVINGADKLQNKPGAVATVEGTGDDPLNKGIRVIPGAQLGADVMSGDQFIKQDQTNVTGAFPTLAGSGNVDTRTATGIQVMQAQGTAGLTPALLLNKAVDEQWGKQVLKLAKKHYTEERFVPYLDEGENASEDGEWLLGSNLTDDFTVEAIDGSWVPRSEEDEMAGINNFMTLGQLPGGAMNPAVPIGVRRRYAELCRVPLDADGIHPAEREARRRLDKMRAAVQYMGQQGYQPREGEQITPDAAGAVAAVAQPKKDADKHPVFIQYYQQVIESVAPGSENDNPLLVTALILAIRAHKNTIAEEAQEDTQRQMTAQAPMMEAQQQMAQGQAQGQAAQAQAQQQMEAMQQQSQDAKDGAKLQLDAHKAELQSAQARHLAVIDSAEKEAQREHDAAEKEKDRAHQLKLAKMKPTGGAAKK